MTAQEPKRRRFPRIPSENAVLVNRLGEQALEALTKTRIMGLGGCMFTSKESFGEGALLEVLISVKHRVIKCLARVVYEIPENDDFEVGVEFLFLPEANRGKIGTLFNGEETEADI